MTEKQRWLIGDLEKWRDGQLNAIGKYGPRVEKEPRELIALRRRMARLTRQIARKERIARKPYERAKAAIYAKHQSVRRVILFEKTEAALRAIRGLK